MTTDAHNASRITPPRHLAIIMDGNGRWARQRGLPRIEGHRAGAKTVRRVVEFCAETGVKYLTLYAFSTENWSRPPDEIDQLMKLLQKFLDQRRKDLHKHDIRLRTIGDTSRLPEAVRRLIATVETETAQHSSGTLLLALNYGGREEIVRAMNRLLADQTGVTPDIISPEAITANLDTAGIPDPDLIIRTSGEMRLSNFLLWQASYAELWFTNTLWPDFSKRELQQAFSDFSQRKRRYGGLGQDA